MDNLLSPAQEILIVLNRNNKKDLTMSDIVFIGKMNRQTVYNNLRILLNLGLVVEKREDGFPPRRLISLTEKGRKVAEKLEEIEKVLEG
jgi:DNA-binding MarR family transcriptional regulator